MDLSRIEALLRDCGEPPYRFRQLYRGATRGLAGGYEEISPLPRELCRRLAGEEPLLELHEEERSESVDGTIKLRYRTPDGFPVEAVAMRHRDRRTVCVSSQSGCPLACTFCATGTMGLGRNLRRGEILEQVLRLARLLRERGERVQNVVLMGMGEPFLNYDEAIAACRLMNDPDGLGLAARSIAVSTAGWVPGIDRLADEPLQLRLALSLHAPNDALRGELMPVTRRFPVGEVLAACRRYRAATGRRIFVEYLLLEGVNDSDELASELGALLAGGGYHVNLIAYNPTAAGYRASPSHRVAAFARALEAAGVGASYRRSHGRDIAAACGQLSVGGVRELRRARRPRRQPAFP